MARISKSYDHAYVRGNMVWVRGRVNGEYVRVSTGKSVSSANMNFVEKHWEEILSEKLQKQEESMAREKIPTLEEFVPLSLKMNEDTADSHTIKSYEGMLRKHILPIYGDKKIDEISVADVRIWQQSLYQRKKLSYKTIKNLRAAWSSVFRYAIEYGYVSVNPVLSVKLPSKKKFVKFDESGRMTDLKGREIEEDIDPFTLDEVMKLIENAEGQFANILTVLFFTGMRLGELVALCWKDIDWHASTIRIRRSRKRNGDLGLTKNGKSREIDILGPVAKALKKQYKLTGLQNGFVFLNQYGERYKDYDVLREHFWRGLLRKTGLAYRTLYQTRHTFASIMLQHGEDLAWISQRMLGHSEISTTLRFYSKYIPQGQKKHAAFLNDLSTNRVQMQSA